MDIRTDDSMRKEEAVETLRQQIHREWKALWDQKIEDKLVAESVARDTYPLLFVDQGTVIQAPRKYKPPMWHEILARHERAAGSPLTPPDPEEGGYRKFARTVLAKQARWRSAALQQHQMTEEPRRHGPRKKGGRGWLHTS
jgi:hypothetical protein